MAKKTAESSTPRLAAAPCHGEYARSDERRTGLIETATQGQRAAVRVRLLDVSRADAPSRVVAEVVLPGISHEGGAAQAIPFRLSAGPLDARAHYILGAHIDLQGTGRTEPGDLITVQSYPVSSSGSPGRVAMRVEEVS